MDEKTLATRLADLDLAAQRAAEERLDRCWDYLDAESCGEEDQVEEPPTLAPFCGCRTCEVREVLDAAYPFLREGWEAERGG